MSALGRVNRRTAPSRPMVGSARITAKARWWARSGSSLDRTEEKRKRYMPMQGYRACGSGLRVLPRGIRFLVLAAEQGDGVLEILERVEGLIDTREAQVRDLIEFAKRREDRESDLVRVDLAGAGLPDRLLDLLRQDREIGVRHRSPLTRLA